MTQTERRNSEDSIRFFHHDNHHDCVLELPAVVAFVKDDKGQL